MEVLHPKHCSHHYFENFVKSMKLLIHQNSWLDFGTDLINSHSPVSDPGTKALLIQYIRKLHIRLMQKLYWPFCGINFTFLQNYNISDNFWL